MLINVKSGRVGMWGTNHIFSKKKINLFLHKIHTQRVVQNVCGFIKSTNILETL